MLNGIRVELLSTPNLLPLHHTPLLYGSLPGENDSYTVNWKRFKRFRGLQLRTLEEFYMKTLCMEENIVVELVCMIRRWSTKIDETWILVCFSISSKFLISDTCPS